MSVHPIALAVVLSVAAMLVLLPRERILAPFLVVAVFLPLAQGFQLAGLDFNFARLLIVVTFCRFLCRGELALEKWNPVDTAIILWCGVGAVAYVTLWGTFDAVINRLGHVLNYAGTYFIVRLSLKSVNDIHYLAGYLRVAAAVLGVFMMVESLTTRNLFALFGGVPEITWIRDGRIRSQGPFGHPIGAGLFAGSLIPLFIGFIAAGRNRMQNLAAIGASLFAVVATASSAPVLGLAGGIAAWCFWPLRRRMRLVCWTLVATMVCLDVAMEAPVWALIQRASVFGGSSSWHRFSLFDQFMQRFGEWWLVGTQSTAHWGYYSFDVANNYVNIGVTGGVFTLIAFLLLLRKSFLAIGGAVRATDDPREQALTWAFGASLMVHVVGSFGVSYWDQTMFLFAILLGLVSGVGTIVGAGSGKQPVTATRSPVTSGPVRWRNTLPSASTGSRSAQSPVATSRRVWVRSEHSRE